MHYNKILFLLLWLGWQDLKKAFESRLVKKMTVEAKALMEVLIGMILTEAM